MPWGKKNPGKNPLRKLLPSNMPPPPGKLSPEKLPPKKCPQENCAPPGQLPPEKLFD